MSSFAIDLTTAPASITASVTADQRAVTVTSAVGIPASAYIIVDSTIAVSTLPPQCVIVPDFATAVSMINAAGQMPVIINAGLAAQHMDSPWLNRVNEISLTHDATKYMRALAKLPRLGVTVRFGLVERGVDVVPAIGRDALSVTARRAAACELLWAIGGSRGLTPTWRHATSRPALDARDLVCYRPGECGPVYGHQWRAWGSLWYCESSANKRPSRGHDQLSAVIASLRDECAKVDHTASTYGTHATRLVSAWAADDLEEMALEPTHHAFQLILRGSGALATLDCAVSMTRVDLWTELPHVVTMYALLTHMVARVVGVRSGRLAVTVADAHGRADAAVPMRAVPVTMPAAESIDEYVRAGVDKITFAW